MGFPVGKEHLVSTLRNAPKATGDSRASRTPIVQSTRLKLPIEFFCWFFPLSVFADIKTSSGAESQNHSGKAAIRSSSSEENDSVRKPPLYQGKREKTRDSQSMFATQVMLKSGYESGYDAGETDNELDQDHTHHLYR